MRISCFIRNWGCDWKPLWEEWLPVDATHATVRLLCFERCPHCHTTRATITSPEPEEARLVIPTRTYSSDDPITA
jgi:hypothetical protein